MHLLGLLGRGHHAGANGPDRLVGDDDFAASARPTARPASLRSARGRPPPSGRPAAAPAFRRRRRSASGRRPARPAPCDSRPDSISLKICRRSLWPRITYLQPISTQHRRADFAGERALGFVIAVLGAQADRRTVDRLADRFQIEARRADGHIDRRRARRPSPRSPPASATPSARVVFIFQLPAMNLRRMSRPIVQNRRALRVRVVRASAEPSGSLLLGHDHCTGRRNRLPKQLRQLANLHHQLGVLLRQQGLRAVGLGPLGAIVNFDVHAVGADGDAGQGTRRESSRAGRSRGSDRR